MVPKDGNEKEIIVEGEKVNWICKKKQKIGENKVEEGGND